MEQVYHITKMISPKNITSG